jgi:hypothetical protein
MFRRRKKSAATEPTPGELIEFHPSGQIVSRRPPVDLRHGWMRFSGSRTRIYVLNCGNGSYYAHAFPQPPAPGEEVNPWPKTP